jgi:transposase
LGHLLALRVTSATEQDRSQVEALAKTVQEATGESVELAYVDRGYTGEKAAAEAEAQGIRLEVVKYQEARRGFVLLPRRWVVERSFAWATRFRRLARDYERLPETVGGCTSSLLPASFYREPSPLSVQVHNTLQVPTNPRGPPPISGSVSDHITVPA